MRENALLPPHRGPQGPVNDHDGRITTDAPGVMWGTDAAVIPTVEDGNIALFVVVEHWNAEGSAGTSPKRPTASPPPRLSISPSTPPAGRCGPTPPAAFCSATTTPAPFASDPVQNQIAVLGMTPSFAFVRQPETNGVAERFIRTSSRSCGAGFRNAEEVRAAVRAFVARYNEHWLLEKNAYRSPAQTRREWFAALASIKAAA